VRIAPFTISLTLALAAPGVASALTATDWVQCVPAEVIPPFADASPPLPEGDDSTLVGAERAQYLDRNLTVFEGDVTLNRGKQWLATPRLVYDQAKDTYVADGEVRFQDPSIRFRAAHMEGEPGQDLTRLDDVTFQIIDLEGNGHASKVVMRGQKGTMRDALYSSCPPDHRQWSFRGNTIRINRDTGVGTVTNGALYLGRVPVFYLPWATFPIDERRRSGFLAPTLAVSGANGADVWVPYYLNLAPNYDATLSLRYLGSRGVMYGSEFRYLTENSNGIFEGNWLPNDDRLGRDRGFASLEHITRFSPYWQARADLNNVSDDRYFEDFGSSLTAASTRLLASSAGFYGRGKYWNASLSAQIWDLTDPLLDSSFEPFRRLPRVQFSWEQPVLGDWLVAGLKSEAVAFDHQVKADARRVDLRPYIQLPFEGASWYVRPELAYRFTAYSLDNSLKVNGDKTPIRSLPIASIDAGMFFERPVHWGGEDLIHTLEPRLFYLRVPGNNQTDLPILDTQELTFGYGQLFRSNRFTGADRQSEANQLTFAVTSRLMQTHSGRELVSATVAQALLFSPSRTALPGQVVGERDLSPLVVELAVNLNDRWTLTSAQHIDVDQGFTELSAFRLQYRFLEKGLANLSYRFRANELEQLDGSVLYPVSPSWRLVGRWNYSLRDNSTLEALGGFEWQSCCMAVRLMGRHFVRTIEGGASNEILLELELRGLGAFGRRTGSLLERAILGYDR